MLDHFLDAYDNQTDKFKIDIEMIRQNFEILLFAGIDTSSNVASMATYNLAKNPEVKA
jgi:cytochrome P450